MAATVSAWSKPGAWALDSEEHEDELLRQRKQEPVNGNHHSNGAASAAVPASDFPELATAAAAKPKKKSKGQTFSLHEFTSYGNPKQPPSQASKGLTPDELSALPTGPRQRSAEELDRSRGFRSYGSSYDKPSRGPSDEQPRRQRDSSREFAPSRADEIDDWGAEKKLTNGFESRERGERGGFFSDSQSRADEVDNWASNKTFVPSESRRNDRRGGFESNGGGGGADSGNWVKRKEEDGRRFASLGGAFDSLRERRGGNSETGNGADSDTWGKKREEGSARPRLNLQPRTLPVVEGQQQNQSLVKPKGSSPFGDARPREEVLKDKGQDWKEIDEKLESVKIKETLPVVEGQQQNESLVKPKWWSPFGDARPREEVLKEKGKDWKEIDEKLESVKIKEAAEERPAFGKKGFGIGNWRGSSQEDRIEKTWRKPEPEPAPQHVDTRPPSAGKTEDGPAEEAEDKDLQM